MPDRECFLRDVGAYGNTPVQQEKQADGKIPKGWHDYRKKHTTMFNPVGVK
ncbi:hypothetical protein BROSI_A1545 [Candidatus Brocadia sinica JPN1]|uniref:Uncharacterized protein n=1 Tax=Candidatus Brocadia sinica JPN1 TaxID=1197129 RepID=A0ABQ0JWG2_9BACT|nr:hypothetical protein BROSI_A1545 [Candidatus Brocadia sinica JPN1]